jgi:outer membrane protein insertion porin family
LRLRKIGGNFAFTRPLNGGDPFKDAPWRVLVGMGFENVRPINFAADSRPYGVATRKLNSGKVKTKILFVSHTIVPTVII